MKRFFVILLFFFGSYTVYSQTIDSFLKSFINNDNLSDSVAVFIHKQGLPYNNSDSVAIALDISRDYYGDTLIAIHTYYGKPSWVKEYICFDHDKITVYVSSANSGINVPLVAEWNVPPVAQSNVPPQKWLR